MAKYGPSAAWLLVDGLDLGGYLTEFSDTKEGMTEEATTLGSSWVSHLGTGLRKLSITAQGFYDDATNASNTALSGKQQTSRIVCYGHATNSTLGAKFVGAEGAYAGTYDRVAVRNGLTKANSAWTVSGQVDEGIVLQELATKTATWNTEGADSQDNAASTSNGGVGYLQVTAYSGLTSVTVAIRHSADDVTYATLATFTAVTAGPIAHRVTAAGTVNRHLAVTGTVVGTGSVTLMAGFARG